VILALDTSSAASAAVVDEAGASLGRSRPLTDGRQARHLLECVHEALTAAGVSLAAVDTVVCGLGPGTFTGLRIGIAAARALAQGAGLELAGVPSLEALAWSLACGEAGVSAPCGEAAASAPCGEAGASAPCVVPLIDGRRGEVFAGVYRVRSAAPGAPSAWPRLEPLVSLAVVPAADLAAFLAPWPGALVGGDGALLHADRLPPAVVHERAVAAPDALMVARAFLSGSSAATRGFGATLPMYGREPDAVPGVAPPPGRAGRSDASSGATAAGTP
jgi:tRNA threonylcarbamoyladenosine biosynthesis protein TsaB